jgi:hypothetical protein
LTYANVVSTLCLFIVLGGGAYAAAKLDSQGASKKFGSSVYFGSANNVGPFSSGAGGGNGVPLIGRLDANQGYDGSGGPHLLVAPVQLRLRDFRMKTFSPVERPVHLHIFKGDPDAGHALLGCTIKAGEQRCLRSGPSAQLAKGETATAQILAPPKPGTFSEHDFLYSYRIVPG